MEKEPFESDIDRESPQITLPIRIGEKVVQFALNYLNSAVVHHDRGDVDEVMRFRNYDHIFFVNDDGDPTALFRDGEDGMHTRLMKMMVKNGFDIIRRRYPSPEDEETFIIYQRAKLDRDLKDL